MRDCWRGWLAKMYDYDLLAFTTKEVTAIKILITVGRAKKTAHQNSIQYTQSTL